MAEWFNESEVVTSDVSIKLNDLAVHLSDSLTGAQLVKFVKLIEFNAKDRDIVKDLKEHFDKVALEEELMKEDG